MSKVIVCDCGRVHWASRRLRDLHAFIAAHPRTSREAADRFGWSVQNANNKMHALVLLGLAESVEERTRPSGGIEHLWRAKHATQEEG